MVPLINALKSSAGLLGSIKNSFVPGPNDKVPDRNPLVFMGPLASGSAVLADDKKVASIRRNNRKLIGIDMETFAVFYAAQIFAASNAVTALSIKSVSDFADHRKDDRYRNYAAHTSAHFVRHLISEHL